MRMEERCPRCCLHRRGCVCAVATPHDNRTRVVVLRHRAEVKKPSNTARLAALALSQCTIVDYGGIGDVIDAAALTTPGTVLVFPDGATTLDAPPTQLLVLDGTWAQCRRMVRRVPGLATLPRLSLLSSSRLRMRQPPPGGMSTIEAIAGALAQCGEPELEAPLLALFDAAVQGSRPAHWPHRQL